MKTLKITVLALFMAATNLVCAQGMEGKSAEEKAKMETKELTEKLGLSADQQKTVSTAALTRAKQVEADREKYKGDREGMKAARKTNNETFESSVKNVLTPDQKTKFEQMLKDKAEKRGGAEKPAGQ
jgi:ribosomal protein L19E